MTQKSNLTSRTCAFKEQDIGDQNLRLNRIEPSNSLGITQALLDLDGQTPKSRRSVGAGLNS